MHGTELEHKMTTTEREHTVLEFVLFWLHREGGAIQQTQTFSAWWVRLRRSHHDPAKLLKDDVRQTEGGRRPGTRKRRYKGVVKAKKRDRRSPERKRKWVEGGQQPQTGEGGVRGNEGPLRKTWSLQGDGGTASLAPVLSPFPEFPCPRYEGSPHAQPSPNRLLTGSSTPSFFLFAVASVQG